MGSLGCSKIIQSQNIVHFSRKRMVQKLLKDCVINYMVMTILQFECRISETTNFRILFSFVKGKWQGVSN